MLDSVAAAMVRRNRSIAARIAAGAAQRRAWRRLTAPAAAVVAAEATAASRQAILEAARHGSPRRSLRQYFHWQSMGWFLGCARSRFPARWFLARLARVERAPREDDLFYRTVGCITRQASRRTTRCAAYAYELACGPAREKLLIADAIYAVPLLFWLIDHTLFGRSWLSDFRWLATRVRPPVAVLLRFWAETMDSRQLGPWLAARLPPDIYAAGPGAR